MGQSVLVVPGTGKQGSAVVKELLKQGFTVHSLTRSLSSAKAQELQAAGAHLHLGDLGDEPSIQKALQWVDAVFLALPATPNQEIYFANNVITAAKQQGIENFVFSGVARTGQHTNFPSWSDNYPLAWYWKNKHSIETLLRTTGFKHLTILRPAFFMQNFCLPEVGYMFAGLSDTHVLSVPYNTDTRLDLVDVADIAKVAAAALKDPSKFSGQEIELAAEKLTAHEIAGILCKISGHDISVKLIDEEKSSELAGSGNLIMQALQWHRDVGYGVSLDQTKSLGISMTPLTRALTKDSLGW